MENAIEQENYEKAGHLKGDGEASFSAKMSFTLGKRLFSSRKTDP